MLGKIDVPRLIMRPSGGIIFEFTEEYLYGGIYIVYFFWEGGVGRGVSWASPLL